MRSLFIQCPWSEIPSNENFVSKAQIKTMFTIIMKIIGSKRKCEMMRAADKHADVSHYDLNNIAVFNRFANEISSKVIDIEASDYVMKCLRSIKACNYKKAKKTIETLTKLIYPNKMRFEMFSEFVSTQKRKFIDFLYIFNNCEKKAFGPNSEEILQISREFEQYKSNVLGSMDINL